MEGLPSVARWGDLSGATVLVRVDFNTPVAEVDGRLEVSDDFRIRAALPLLADLLARGATVRCATHFGRPHGKVVAAYSVEPVRRRLGELAPGVELLENLRFNPGEEANDPAFGAALVEGVDYYVNEAFGASHRAHASIMVPPTLVPSAAGPNLAREVESITSALESPTRPLVAVVGGAKVADKLGVVRALVARADEVIVGGGMAYTFLAAAGHSVGDSLMSPEHLDECAALLATGRVRLPVDGRGLRAGAAFGAAGGADPVVEFSEDVPEGVVGLDVGPRSEALFAEILAGAGTVLWNGPMGVFEDERFAAGTLSLARAVAGCRGRTVVGGGDSVAALARFGLEGEVDFVSTGGGATLELVEFGDLPGLQALRESSFP